MMNYQKIRNLYPWHTRILSVLKADWIRIRSDTLTNSTRIRSSSAWEFNPGQEQGWIRFESGSSSHVPVCQRQHGESSLGI